MIAKALAFMVLASLFGATGQTIYTRVGGPASVKPIKSASGNPITIRVASTSGISEADFINIHMVAGNAAANGIRRIKPGTLNDTSFQITDLEGVDVNSNGTFVSGQGWVGKVQASTIPEGPGLFFSSKARARITDPDGLGGAVAPAISRGSCGGDRSECTNYDALLGRLGGGYSTSNGCDGQTPGLCVNEDRMVRSFNVNLAEAIPVLLAISWHMDNSRTAHLNAAKYYINHVDQFLSDGTFAACDESAYHCGRGSQTDWASHRSANMAIAYALIRNQLTAEERQTFARKMLNDSEDGCTNTLQKQAGSAGVTAGSATVTGSGLSVYGSNDWIYFKLSRSTANGIWKQVASVQSDNQLTLTSTMAVNASEIDHHRVLPWQSSSCGIKWFERHYGTSPVINGSRAKTTLAEAIGAGADSIVLHSLDGFPNRAPFPIRLDSEWVRVASVSGEGPYTLKIERAQYYTNPASHKAGTVVEWNQYIWGSRDSAGTTFYTGSFRHNLVMAKIYGMFLVGLALSKDHPRAPALAQSAFNYWYDLIYPWCKENWTGQTGGSSTSGYHLGRWADFTFQIAGAAKYGLSPGVDAFDGNWLKNFANYILYAPMPYNPGAVHRYSDAGNGEQLLENDDFKWLPIFLDEYTGTPEAAYLNFWLRNVSRAGKVGFLHYTAQTSSLGQEVIPYYLAFTDDRQPVADYRDKIPLYRFLDQVDLNPGYPLGTAYSRTNWKDPAATLLLVLAPNYLSDHWPSYAGPGNYKIAKNTKLLDDNNTAGQAGAAPQRSNYVEIGGTNNVQLGGAYTASFDRKKGTADYVYMRVKTAGAYRNLDITRAFRHILHFVSGPRDYIVVYDDVATAGPKQKVARLHYFFEGEPAYSFSRNGGDIVFTKPASQARLSSRVVLPDASAISDTSVSPGRYAVTVTMDAGQTPATEFLVVHRPAANTHDRMPEVSRIEAASPGWRGVLVNDESAPRIALFAAGGLDTYKTVNFTPSAYSGSAKIVVTGLDAGEYNVLRDGSVVLSNVPVGPDGVLAFDSMRGAFTAVQVGSLRSLEILSTSPIPVAQMGMPYSETLLAQGGSPPYGWSIVAGALPEGVFLSPSGEISGMPSQWGDHSFTVEVTDSSSPALKASKDLSLTVPAPDNDITLSHSNLDFQHVQSGLPPDPITVMVSSTTPGLFVSIEKDTPWITVAPESITTDGSIQIGVDPAGLEPGDYVGSVTLSSPLAMNSPVALTIGLSVSTDILQTTRAKQLPWPQL